MNVLVVGGGNIGSYLVSILSEDKNNRVTLYTSKPEVFNDRFEIIEEENGSSRMSGVFKATNNLREASSDADLILITFPTFMAKDFLTDLSKYVKDGCNIGFTPGFGGKEFLMKLFEGKNCTFFGTQRVPAIIRVKEYGKSVIIKEVGETVSLASIPKEKSLELSNMMSSLLGIPFRALDNYITITLTPSNPAMHPSRCYELFKDNKYFSKNPLFYEEWGDFASDCLIKIDDEIDELYKKLSGINYEHVETIKNRFNIKTPSELTEKIRNKPGFKSIGSPVKEVENGFMVDFDSRYFGEDLPYGLCLLKAFGDILEVELPLVTEIIKWYEKETGSKYIVNGKIEGEELLIPQNFGINNREDLLNFYGLN